MSSTAMNRAERIKELESENAALRRNWQDTKSKLDEARKQHMETLNAWERQGTEEWDEAYRRGQENMRERCSALVQMNMDREDIDALDLLEWQAASGQAGEQCEGGGRDVKRYLRHQFYGKRHNEFVQCLNRVHRRKKYLARRYLHSGSTYLHPMRGGLIMPQSVRRRI